MCERERERARMDVGILEGEGERKRGEMRGQLRWFEGGVDRQLCVCVLRA